MNFREKVQSMTGKEIIMAMVEGLRTCPITVIMSSYGNVDIFKGVCYGCAATATIMKISGVIFDRSNINNRELKAKAINSDSQFYDIFEDAINYLRIGMVDNYNLIAMQYGFACIDCTYQEVLPVLHTDNYMSNLGAYISLANRN